MSCEVKQKIAPTLRPPKNIYVLSNIKSTSAIHNSNKTVLMIILDPFYMSYYSYFFFNL